MNSLRDSCLIVGIREAEFWEMTAGEAVRECDAYQDRRRDRAYFEYTNAMTTGMFVASMFSSKPPPKLSDIYPDLFDEDEEAEEEKKATESAANFINFANAFNRKFGNGDNGKSESENNG